MIISWSVIRWVSCAGYHAFLLFSFNNTKNCNVGGQQQYQRFNRFYLFNGLDWFSRYTKAMSTCQKHSKRKRREWIETIACYLCPSDAIKMPEKSQLHNQAEKNGGKKSKNLQELKTNSPLLCIIWRSIGILCGFSSRNILEALLFSHDSLRILLNPKSVRRFLAEKWNIIQDSWSL